MLFDLQLEFEKLTISLNSKSDKFLFNQISNKFGLVEDLRISPSWHPGFSPVFTSWPQKIIIMNSAWFTLESLLACPCTRIKLGCSPLGDKDVDEILQKWKAGGFPYLEYLFVEGESISNRWNRWMVIQTDDVSKKATIHTDYKRIEISVTPFD
ncbi:hypothetical protein CRE_22007 [Caenorhabditis remanei]|uniref:Sdz-33 F-box domain-containing protein n=1 Tax=Caenorhabditis remanei TaxID=31234 RepID=E3N3B9_CAERE|nr:hypothetical protein CRE_22007 [Caenorhabditis remanei]